MVDKEVSHEGSLVHFARIPQQGTNDIIFFGRKVLVVRVNGTPKAVFNFFCMHVGRSMRRNGEKLVFEWHGAE